MSDDGRCRECGGFVDNTGLCVDDFMHNSGWLPCLRCDGHGEWPDNDGDEEWWATCGACGGLGLREHP